MPENKDDIDLEGWDLHRAAREDRSKEANDLIWRGHDIEAKDAEGDTPLHVSASYNLFRIAWELIEQGADIETKDVDGYTPELEKGLTT